MKEEPKVDRRGFVRLMAASATLAGLTGCTRQPEEKILPYASSPEETVPGEPLYYATAMPMGGYGIGVLVESHDGRPTKVEGNPQHPASLGATDVFAQASVLTLYDPDRAQVVTHAGRLSRWMAFVSQLNRELGLQKKSQGAGLRVLTQTITSPTLGQQLDSLRDTFPAARWHQYEPAGRDAVREGARLAFGSYVHTIYRFDRAEVVVSLDADFLYQSPGSVRYARDASKNRRKRLYVVESVPSITGAMADHRLPLRASELTGFARVLADELGVLSGSSTSASLSRHARDWAAAVARDLARHRRSTIVISGDQQPPVVHLLSHAINERLGNSGQTVLHTDPVEALPVNQMDSLKELVRDMEAGRVELLIILGGNPVYDAPADLSFGEQLSKVKFRAHLSLYHNETSRLCHWHIPEAHYLESWSDTRAYDGTASIIQPLIAPLHEGKSAHEMLAAVTGRPDRSGYDVLRDYWRGRAYGLFLRSGRSMASEKDFEGFWRKALHDGLIPGTEADPVSVAVRPNLEPVLAKLVSNSNIAGLEIIFRPDATVWDGRFANNGWLQELPKPLTKLTWDNAACLSPTTAEHLALRNGDVIELRLHGRAVEAPVWILPGHAHDAVSVTLGYGRTHGGPAAVGAGFDAYKIRESDGFWFALGAEIRKTGKTYVLATTQHHHRMEGRNLVRVGETVGDSAESREGDGYDWGMAVDLNACTGCNACVVACTAENNVPVVGKEEVLRGREMHWIRIDRYYAGPLENPVTYHQPVMCMHCESAPCEVVCPVGATVHSLEGLNEMVYNRCVGSRYCANNCPYKVRRFNFLQYADLETPSLKMLNNPDVTVRTRGVVEKCTYCVQRINYARIQAEKEGRRIRDGEIVTACQAVCPAEAIVFGNLKDPESRVRRLFSEARSYGLLAELSTRPRTRYLARLWNRNAELAGESKDG